MRSAPLIVCALIPILTATAHIPKAQALSSRRSAVRVENDILVNSRAGYYFAMPQGWVLDSVSDYEHLTVRHPESGAVFSVDKDHARGTPTMYYMSMQMSLESPDHQWLSFGKGHVMLGGREAMGFRGTREKNGTKIKEIIWVALVGEYVYLLMSTVDLDKFDDRAPQIDQMFSSFSWGKPPSTP